MKLMEHQHLYPDQELTFWRDFRQKTFSMALNLCTSCKTSRLSIFLKKGFEVWFCVYVFSFSSDERPPSGERKSWLFAATDLTVDSPATTCNRFLMKWNYHTCSCCDMPRQARRDEDPLIPVCGFNFHFVCYSLIFAEYQKCKKIHHFINVHLIKHQVSISKNNN